MKNNNKIRKAETFEDIVFEHRNKAYGAYDLNKKGCRYLFSAFLVTLFFFASAFTYPLLRGDKIVEINVPNLPTEFQISSINTDAGYAVPPSIDNKIRIDPYLPPEIISDAPVENSLLTTGELIDKVLNMPVDTSLGLIPTELTDSDAVKDADSGEPFVIVEEPARFMDGNLNTFHSWVMENIQYPDMAINHEITGRVYVSFCINTHGKVVDIKIIRGPDESINNEVIRVLESSPEWYPARQGGRKVKQLFSMSVLFQLQKK